MRTSVMRAQVSHVAQGLVALSLGNSLLFKRINNADLDMGEAETRPATELSV